MVFVTYKVVEQWYNRRFIDWQGDLEEGLFLFILTMTVQWWARHKVRQQEAKAAQELTEK